MDFSRATFAVRALFAALVALALALAPASASRAGGHAPAALEAAELSRHADLGVVDPDHGHSHDDGDPHERAPGHAHGHNPTDHLHDAGAVVGFEGKAAEFAPEAVAPMSARTALRHLLFPPDRPPRA